MAIEKTVNIVGAGLAGVEAAHLLSRLGFRIRLFEMKPLKYTEAHTSPKLGELVCSNSLKSLKPDSAAGLLKTEMLGMGSLVMYAAQKSKVPAGHALAVNRERFASVITDVIMSDPSVSLITTEVHDIADDDLTIISTWTSDVRQPC